MTNNEFIEIHLDAETKQLAERTATTLGYATLTEFFIYLIQKFHHNFQFICKDFFKNFMLSALEVPIMSYSKYCSDRLKQAAQLLDKENF